MESEHFRDFDEFAESIRDVDAQMMFQNPTQRGWEINHLNLPQVHVQLGRLGSGNIVEGQSGQGGYLLYLPLTEECEYAANGVVIPKHAFMVLEPGCEFCIATKFEHDWCTIVIPSELLPERADDQEPSEKMPCRVTRPNRRAAERFLAQVHSQLATATQHPEFEGSNAATRAARELLEIGGLILQESDAVKATPPGRPKASRTQIIRRAMESLEAREDVTVADLAASVGVSERTLRTAFDEYYGVGPLRYLQLRTLHRVHHALKAAESEETTVANALLEHGVWELGRFAARYRKQFGELPSETLRAKRQ